MSELKHHSSITLEHAITVWASLLVVLQPTVIYHCRVISLGSKTWWKLFIWLWWHLSMLAQTTNWQRYILLVKLETSSERYDITTSSCYDRTQYSCRIKPPPGSDISLPTFVLAHQYFSIYWIHLTINLLILHYWFHLPLLLLVIKHAFRCLHRQRS